MWKINEFFFFFEGEGWHLAQYHFMFKGMWLTLGLTIVYTILFWFNQIMLKTNYSATVLWLFVGFRPTNYYKIKIEVSITVVSNHDMISNWRWNNLNLLYQFACVELQSYRVLVLQWFIVVMQRMDCC